MTDDDGSVEITITLPREAADYAAQVLRQYDIPMRSVDPARPADLLRPDGSQGADWPMFDRFAQAAVWALIAEEWRKRERPDSLGLREAEPPLPGWVSYVKPLRFIFDDDVPY